MVLIVLAAPVAHKLEATQNLANGEETDEFCTDDANANHLRGTHVANGAEDVAGGAGGYRLPRRAVGLCEGF